MRLHGLDIARFLAFCGMVLVNFRIAAGVTPGTDTASLLTSALEGRAAALFVVLAGIGLSLGRPDRITVFRRAVFLFVIGLLNLTIFEADILHFYALYFLLALPFLTAPGRMLLRAAAMILLIGFVSVISLDYEANWDWKTLTYANFWTVEGFLRHSLYNGWHPVFPWAAFLFLGMWAGRLQLSSRRVQAHLVLWGAAAAVLGTVPGMLVQDPELAELFGTSAIPPGPFYILSASGSALAVTGLVLALTPALDKAGLADWLAAPGRQALSLYAAHILLGMGTLEAMGQLDGALSPAQIFGFSLGFCALSMVLVWVWNLFAKRGPLEALMHWSTNLAR
ncbi:heparan-alpha-glucosaminide N-acetyltransferase domain-containing protein [Leisingera sp. S132]|uniref:DUF418 domain-containing protein n=1 Tax=Leisingera sp. S132 TaxID=2867016 RepID=UPI0021A61044|nr:heparan-alpha-glucosaminide N-acetyltransferase domain-containing protein [Leisingera sp. S132]UWQ78434.1 heparan-alpha-glucosaminide N-acetyltransferase domain-containing protein [Leisingera sp. S132]